MGSILLTGLAGEGSNLFAGGAVVAPSDFEYKVTAWPPTIRQFGMSHPLALWNLGVISLGGSAAQDTTFGSPFYSQPHFIRFEQEDVLIASPQVLGPFFADSIFWRFKVGVSVNVWVFW